MPRWSRAQTTQRICDVRSRSAEVPVAVAVRLEVADLAAHPERDERALDDVLRRLRQRRDGDRGLRGSRRDSDVGVRGARGWRAGARERVARASAPARASRRRDRAPGRSRDAASRRSRHCRRCAAARTVFVQQHRDGHRAHAARHRRDERRDLRARRRSRTSPTSRVAALRRRVGDAVHADVDHDGARLDHVAVIISARPDGGDEDVGAARVRREIARAAVADGDRRVGARRRSAPAAPPSACRRCCCARRRRTPRRACRTPYSHEQLAARRPACTARSRPSRRSAACRRSPDGSRRRPFAGGCGG